MASKIYTDEELKERRRVQSLNYYYRTKGKNVEKLERKNAAKIDQKTYRAEYHKLHYTSKKKVLTDEEKKIKNDIRKQKLREYQKRWNNLKKLEKGITTKPKKEKVVIHNISSNKEFKSTHFINDTELYYELIISSGKARMSKKLEIMLIKLCNKLITKFNFHGDYELRNDCLQESLCKVFTEWRNFNVERYSKAMPYFTEISKRAIAKGVNESKWKFKANHKQLKTISLTSFI